MSEMQRAGMLELVEISPDLVALGLRADSDREAIAVLYGLLYRRGIVRESYGEAVWAREKRYPTGLQFETRGVALPHTDAIHVNRQAIAIGILEKPVAFRAMGMPKEQVEVSLIFMLALNRPEKEALFLSRMIDVFQKPANLEKIYCAESAEAASQAFQYMFADGDRTGTLSGDGRTPENGRL